jgi:hypothetical protein
MFDLVVYEQSCFDGSSSQEKVLSQEKYLLSVLRNHVNFSNYTQLHLIRKVMYLNAIDNLGMSKYLGNWFLDSIVRE